MPRANRWSVISPKSKGASGGGRGCTGLKNEAAEPRTPRNLEALLRVCARPGRVLILLQNNPDPDALASAKALAEILRQRLGKRAVIGYGGACGRAENRAMIRVLRIGARHLSPDELPVFSTLCLVDTQPVSGNNMLYAARAPEAVIDHHNLPKRVRWTAEVCDVRPKYGACATILYEYLKAAGVECSSSLATALFYGIQSDTQDLARESSPADVRAYQELFLIADKKKLAEIRRAPVSSRYFQALHDSLRHSLVAGNVVITRIPQAANPDLIAEVAELMMRLEGMRTSVCYGACGRFVHLSARAIDARGHVDQRIRRVVARIGTGGGHNTMAGGQVPINGAPDALLAQIHERILRAFAPGKETRPLTRAEG